LRDLAGQYRTLEERSRQDKPYGPVVAHTTSASQREAVETPRAKQAKSLSSGQQLYVSIVEAWVETFSSPHDWSHNPFASFIFRDQFLETLDDQGHPPLERIAWACAKVACKKARRLGGIDPHQLLTGSGGRQLVREDGAKGWRCNLKRNSPGRARLHYGIHPSGLIEFDALGNYDLLGQL